MIISDFSTIQKGDRLLIMDGLAGGTVIISVDVIHLNEQVVEYLGKDGNESFALFEEVIKKL